jgi:hypothetical protein
MDAGDPFAAYREQVEEAVRHAEVISLFFPRLSKALIVDMRPGDDGPVLLIDGMADTPADRLDSFSRLRPALPPPDRLTLAAWHAHVRTLDETGILAALVERCRLEGGPPLAERATVLYRRLLGFEHVARRDLVRGVGMRTLWQRPAAGAH